MARTNPSSLLKFLRTCHRPACQILSNAFLKSMNCGTDRAGAAGAPRSGELRTQNLKSHLVRTQSFNVLPFKP